MRHKYDTRGLILARASAGEANALVSVLTSDLGLVRARAQGIRRPGAKLSAALVTLAESDIVLVRGKEGWRLTGAVRADAWFDHLPDRDARERAGRIISLILRLVAGESPEEALYPILHGLLEALAALPVPERDAVEVLAALYVLAALGFDDSTPPSALFAPEARAKAQAERSAYIVRVNRGIAASGL